MRASDLTTVTPESSRYCREWFQTLRTGGMFTPLGSETTLMAPGTFGGGSWSGGSFDPSTSRFFVNTNELFSVGELKPQQDGAPERYRRSSKFGEYAFFWDRNEWPCQRPPWGSLNAIDVNTGKIVWKVTLGRTDALNRETGAINLGGAIVTAGGLLFIGATVDVDFARSTRIPVRSFG